MLRKVRKDDPDQAGELGSFLKKMVGKKIAKICEESLINA